MGQQIIFFQRWKEQERAFLTLLIRQKKLGFAESNPIADINGSDAAAKIRILSSLSFNKKFIKK